MYQLYKSLFYKALLCSPFNDIQYNRNNSDYQQNMDKTACMVTKEPNGPEYYQNYRYDVQ